ncbi:MAG: hypothetical protein ACOC0Q_10445 [Wenzhouxiangella sp.]
MTDDDFDNFADAWSAAYELCSRGKLPTPGALSLAFEALRPYALDQVTTALTRHARDPDNGRFGLTVADVVRQIDGPTMTVDQVIGAALTPTTPLAVLCRMEIGSWNLGNWTMQQLKPYAERCIALMPEWKQRLAAGEITDHERLAFERYGVQTDNVRQLGAQKRLA